jgi:predicted ATP-dependent endonuclease of OLD family
MYKLESVEIAGFWGEKHIISQFYEDVNIFIGKNGTGKTTFINILQALLTVDVALLSTIDFESVVFNLKSEKATRKIVIERTKTNIPYLSIKYKISTKAYDFYILPKDADYTRRSVMHPQYIENMNKCKLAMNAIIKVSWLSVHREINSEPTPDYYISKKDASEKKSIDIRLDVLMQKLTRYLLSLEYKSNQLSNAFQKDILRAILFNKKFDAFKFEQWQKLESIEIKEGLIHAYKDLKAYDEDSEKQIENHCSAINESITILRKKSEGKEPMTIDDLMPLVSLSRTNHIIDLSKKLEKERDQVFEQLNKYWKILSEYIDDKVLSYNSQRDGQIRVHKNKKEVLLADLSSGEKQLLIILTEALLQNQQPCLFIADEPELSLHIDWQKKLIKSVMEINPNAQVIVATHSPEIAGLWSKNIIDMGSLFQNE